MPKCEYTVKIDVLEDGSIEAQIIGEEPIDLRNTKNWTEAQKTAAGIYIGLGIPRQALEFVDDERGPEQ